MNKNNNYNLHYLKVYYLNHKNVKIHINYKSLMLNKIINNKVVDSKKKKNMKNMDMVDKELNVITSN